VRLAVAGTLMGLQSKYLHILKALTQRYHNEEFEDLRKDHRAEKISDRRK
jgi:hypothetical protein